MNPPAARVIQVAGDICLDVVGIPRPPASAGDTPVDNWRLTGETRTHYLLGGSLLLAELIKAALPSADVSGPRICRPSGLFGAPDPAATSDQTIMTAEELLATAERLTRDEIVHSLLALNYFNERPDSKDRSQIRVESTYGFSGPKSGDPSLEVLPLEKTAGSPRLMVFDDTGNRFRRAPDQWSAVLADPVALNDTLIVHKLHRPLPKKSVSGAASSTFLLWAALSRLSSRNRLTIVSVDDLREEDALISRGLSWERTALDLVWQLLNRSDFAELRDLPHLVVRLGVDGAVYWRRSESRYEAWLIYDPAGIEGVGASLVDGGMVGCGSTFTAALVQRIAESGSLNFETVRDGIIHGLIASWRLLRLGFGERGKPPRYPGNELFGPATKSDAYFACQPIPIIPQAATPDRGYWRLLETIFDRKTAALHRAVALVATGAEPKDPADRDAAALLKQVPTAVFAKALRTCDRREIENYRSLYTLMLDYIRARSPQRPLSLAVFGPPGAGKSFGVKMVAKALGQLGGARPIETLTFNLSQYQAPEQLADAFHLVRDLSLRGRMPLVFFDEFDTSLGGTKLGWLRYFLAPMQDGEFLDRGAPHPIGPAIFVFAGGTCSTYAQFAEPFLNERSRRRAAFKSAKGPDFLSRLRGTLDIPGLNLNVPFDAYGPVDAFPSVPAILLRRAGILAFQLGEKAPQLRDTSRAFQVSPVVLRALLHLPQFEHGNRSFEAMLDMSHLAGASKFTPALLPSPSHAGLHADPLHFSQLLATDYPFPLADRERIAEAIHGAYLTQRNTVAPPDPSDPSRLPWGQLPEDLKDSNRQQADDIAVKLRAAGLWIRKAVPGALPAAGPNPRLDKMIETLAKSEHDRWVAEKRRRGWIAAADTSRASRNDALFIHNFLVPWEQLSDSDKDLDRGPVRSIPTFLAAADFEIVPA